MPRFEALTRQGNSLLEVAQSRAGEEADAFLKAACATYSEALRLKPDVAEARLGLGCARLVLAGRTSDGAERRKLLRLAREALLCAERLGAKAAAYNLACGAALAGDHGGCRMWLERCRQGEQLPPGEQLRADPDLAPMRGESWFAALLA
jgi:hypothetical protein